MDKKEIAYLQYLILLNYDTISDYNEDIEDFEQRDLEVFYKNYPEMRVIPFKTMLNLQRYFNDEELCAGWCWTATPEGLIKFLEQNGETDERQKNLKFQLQEKDKYIKEVIKANKSTYDRMHNRIKKLQQQVEKLKGDKKWK